MCPSPPRRLRESYCKPVNIFTGQMCEDSNFWRTQLLASLKKKCVLPCKMTAMIFVSRWNWAVEWEAILWESWGNDVAQTE